MVILLVAATSLEIQSHVNMNPGPDVLITGAGSIPACYHLQQKLQQANYDFVIQAGIGGVFENKIPLGTVVGISTDCFGDLGFEEKGNFTPLAKTPFLEPDKFPFERGKLVNRLVLNDFSWLEMVNAVTVNKVSDSIEQAEMLRRHFNPVVESMEGAAFHYVCLMQKIPFLQLRAASNAVGERDKSKWVVKEAITNLEKTITKVLDILK